MKLLVLACLLGFSAAAYLRGAAPDGSLKALDSYDSYELYNLEDEIKEDLLTTLRKQLQDILEKIKNGNIFVMGQLMKILGHLKDLGEGIGNKAKEFIKELPDRFRKLVNDALDLLGFDKIGGIGKRDVEKRNLLELLLKINEHVREFIKNIKEKFLENENIQKIREYIQKYIADNDVIQKVKDFMLKLKDGQLRKLIRDLLNLDDESKERRSLMEKWEKIKNYFKDLKIDLQEKFMKFGEWARNTLKEKLDKFKEKTEIIKDMAKEFISKMGDINKEIMHEGLEFFKNYKNELKDLWEMMKEKSKTLLE